MRHALLNPKWQVTSSCYKNKNEGYEVSPTAIKFPEEKRELNLAEYGTVQAFVNNTV